MSEKEIHFIKVLKRWVIGLASAVVLSLVTAIFISWRSAIINTTRLDTIEKVQDAQQVIIDEKASLSMVKAMKENLEQKIIDKFDVLEGKLDMVLKLSPFYNYYDNSKTK